jgi:hypothetical protein
LAGYLPKEWNGKRVAVRFARGRGFDARLVGNNAGAEGSTKRHCRQKAGGARALVPCGSRLRAFGVAPKYLRDLKNILPPVAGKAAGWVEWIRRAVFTSNVRDFCPPPRPWIRVKATALLSVA